MIWISVLVDVIRFLFLFLIMGSRHMALRAHAQVCFETFNFIYADVDVVIYLIHCTVLSFYLSIDFMSSIMYE